MTKTIYEIDKDGFMLYTPTVELAPTGVDDEGLPVYEIPEGYVDTPLPTDERGYQLPFYRPKWDGEKWIEARPQAEIDEELSRPIPPSPTEVIARDLDAMAELVSMVAMTAFLGEEAIATVTEDSNAIAEMVAMVVADSEVIAESVSNVTSDTNGIAEMLAMLLVDLEALREDVTAIKTELPPIK